MRSQATADTSWNEPGLNRFGFNLFIALAAHGLLILSVGFTLPEPTATDHTLDITLAQYAAEEAPENADFFAQLDQLGSGESEEVVAPSAREEAPLESEETSEQSPLEIPADPIPEPEPIEPVPIPEPLPEPDPEPEPDPVPVEQTGTETLVTSTSEQPEQVQDQVELEPASTPPPTVSGGSTSLLARSMEIASLQAQLQMEQQNLAKRPRVRRLTAASTMRHDDAMYLDNWRRRIESIGNLNYPDEARRNNQHGSLRLLVSIQPDGSVQNIEVLQSSGYQVLDDAAVRIVQLAAPFQPFTVEMRKNTDVLEIIRTWKFEKRAQVY
ncbi:energy transducer TonB [Nitrincola sp. MINF-07-Sa-05]|uniref:energy transducer TonB n=1 Tax=Nitrincola salilacus TaxID=3400273 RepID=UPI00391821AD